jgi:hypothetical protein
MGECKGLAIIDRVELSFDGGQTWVDTNLDSKTNTWSFSLNTPMGSEGTYLLMTRATDKSGRIESSVNPNIDLRYRKKSTIVTFVNPGSDNE